MIRMGERGRDDDEGMASAELAVGLVTLLLVLSLALGAVRLGMDRATAISVAGSLAREAARDGDTAALWSQSVDGLPAGARYGVARESEVVVVTVVLPVRAGPLRLALPPATEVRATALREAP